MFPKLLQISHLGRLKTVMPDKIRLEIPLMPARAKYKLLDLEERLFVGLPRLWGPPAAERAQASCCILLCVLSCKHQPSWAFSSLNSTFLSQLLYMLSPI